MQLRFRLGFDHEVSRRQGPCALRESGGAKVILGFDLQLLRLYTFARHLHNFYRLFSSWFNVLVERFS